MLKKAGKIKLKRWLVLPVLAILVFILTEIFSKNPEFVEQYYSQGIYPFIAHTISNISGIFSFSLDDIFYVILIISVLILIIFPILKKAKLKQSGLYLINILASVYILFYLLWGFNYYRPDITKRLDLMDAVANKKEFIRVTEKLIESTNSLHCSFDNLDKNEVDSLIEASYKNLAPVLLYNYPMGKRKDKKITFSAFYAKTGISGYFGPFFNEIHVNKKVTAIEYPSVLAHEKAHQFGITSEAEANFYAWLVCSNSQSQQVKYSGNLIILRRFLMEAYTLKEYPLLVEKIDDKVKNDINYIRQHWLNLRNEKMNRAASKVNDAYLKTNKVEGGIKDYHGVVEHLMNFSLDSAFQDRHKLHIK